MSYESACEFHCYNIYIGICVYIKYFIAYTPTRLHISHKYNIFFLSPSYYHFLKLPYYTIILLLSYFMKVKLRSHKIDNLFKLLLKKMLYILV